MIRFKYSHKDIHNAYEYLVNYAAKKVRNGDRESALKVVDAAARLQYNYNELYKDERLEDLLKEISTYWNLSENIVAKQNVVLFYNFMTMDNRGLTQQYISALSEIPEVNVIYVTEEGGNLKSKDTYDLLNKIGATIYVLQTNKKKYVDLIDDFNSIIEKHKPSSVFLHIAPWTVVPIVSLYCYPSIRKYLINITDHTFGLGIKLVDQSIEFRSYGISLSKKYRGLDDDKICYLPYYPWVSDNVSFKGFPVDTDGKVLLFSGGDFYKITDKNNTFFHLIRRILELNRCALFFYAGIGDMLEIRKLISQYKLEHRFFLLGHRDDISQVFQHSDIYIGTYPVAGGLMAQYAAYYSKPIVALSLQRYRCVLVGEKEIDYGITSVDSFLEEVNRLINSNTYREEKGRLFNRSIISQKDFTTFVKLLCSHQKSGLQYSEYNLCNADYDIKDGCLERLNKRSQKGVVEYFVVKAINYRSFLYMPKIFFNRVIDLFYKYLLTKQVSKK